MSIYEAGYTLGQVDLTIDLDGQDVPHDVQEALECVHFEMIEDRTIYADDPYSFLHNFSSEWKEALLFLLDKLRPFMTSTSTIADYEGEIEHYEM